MSPGISDTISGFYTSSPYPVGGSYSPPQPGLQVMEFQDSCSISCGGEVNTVNVDFTISRLEAEAATIISLSEGKSREELLQLITRFSDFFITEFVSSSFFEKATPEQKSALINWVHGKIYAALAQNSNPTTSFNLTLWTMLAAYDPQLNEAYLPNSPEEEDCLYSFLSNCFLFQTAGFRTQFIDSHRYEWSWEGASRPDGLNPEGKLSCIAFALEYLRFVYGTGAMENVGSKRLTDLSEKTAEDLFPMFDLGMNDVVSSYFGLDQPDDLESFKFITDSDTERGNGYAFYVCQLYSNNAPKHAFVLVILKGKDGNTRYLKYESTPAGVRAIECASLIDSTQNPNIQLSITNIIPADTKKQVALLLGMMRGVNRSKG